MDSSLGGGGGGGGVSVSVSVCVCVLHFTDERDRSTAAI